MDEAHYCPEAFSPITGRCFQVVSRQDAQACWPAVTLSNESALSRFRAYRDPHPPPSGRSAPLTGQQQAECDAICRVSGRPGVAVVAESAPEGLVALMMPECSPSP